MYLIPTDVIEWLKEVAEGDNSYRQQFAKEILDKCNIPYSKGEKNEHS